jgi:hypothetical protein
MAGMGAPRGCSSLATTCASAVFRSREGVAEALELRVRKDDLRAYLAESLERSGGPPTPEELAWAADIVGA